MDVFLPDVGRRRVLKLIGAGGVAAMAGACRPEALPDPAAGEPPAFFKDTTPFIEHGGLNIETPIESLGGFITPNDLFFVRNNARSIAVDPAAYRLEVAGDAASNSLSLTYDDLLAMPSRTVFSYIECGGNQRSFFGSAMGQPAQGTPWGRGGVGMAVWEGVSLREVLARAGVSEQTAFVQMIGLDTEAPEGGFRRPMTYEKAMDEDTILAYRMNGEPLPPDHGFPIRAIVPGWVGSNQIKWLGRIEAHLQPVWSRNVTSSYVLIGDAYPKEGEAMGKIITEQSIKSILILPWPAALPAGRRTIRGYAYSPQGPIERVEWSDGGDWRPARLIDPPMKYAWMRFEFAWEPAPGAYTIRARATDVAGNTQPDSVPFNEHGYLYNVPLAHPVTVT
jgi:DMSO/TMAO reductase YedYZ molybdopterin-dependent catalytic subunit